MRFLQRGKKMSKESKFDISEFVVLGYDELLQVNGAGGKSSGGSGGPTGPSAAPTSSTTLDSNRGYPSSTEGHNSSSPASSGNLSNKGYPSSTPGYNPGAASGSPSSQGYPSSTSGYNTGGNPNSTAQATLKGVQTNVMNNPQYQEGAGGPFNLQNVSSTTTWCNQATYNVVENTGSGLGSAMYGSDSHGYNTNANTAASNLANAASQPNSTTYEVTAEQAQNLANLGYTVVAAMENTVGGSGHLATVAPGYEYSSSSGPTVANVGPQNHTGIETVSSAFGSYYDNGEVHYYYDSTQNVDN